MARQYSYADAARLLGAPQSFLKILDHITTVGLLAGSVAAPTPVLSLFGAKSEAVRICENLMTSLRKNSAKKRQVDRSELLRAAHSIIALTAYFEVFDQLSTAITLNGLELTKREQLFLAGGNITVAESRRDVVDMIASTEIPTPSPATAYETIRKELKKFYQRLSDRLFKFISDLGSLVFLEGSDEDYLKEQILKEQISELALEKYDVLFRQLAADFTEFFIWANLREHQATRQTVLNTND